MALSLINAAFNSEDEAVINQEFSAILQAKAKIDTEIDQLKAQISNLDGQISSSDSEIKTKTQTITASKEVALRSFYEALQKTSNFASAKTDADGKFEIKLPPGLGDFILAASGSRLAGAIKEEYFWCYRPQFDSDGQSTANLSNDNMAKCLDDLRAVVAER